MHLATMSEEKLEKRKGEEIAMTKRKTEAPKDQFVLTFCVKRLKRKDEKTLDSRFKLAHKIKNKLTENAISLIKSYEENEELKQALEKLKNKEITKTEINLIRKKLQKELNLSEFGFTNMATKIGNEFGYKQIGLGSGVLQNISKEVWNAVERYLFKNGEKIRFKKYHEFLTLRNKTNDYAPKLVWHKEDNVIHAHVVYGDLILELKPINKKYEIECFEQAKVHSVSIKRLPLYDGWRYQVQVLFQGVKPQKVELGKGVVGLDLGPSKVAVVSDYVVQKVELFNSLDNKPSRRVQSVKGSVELVGCGAIGLPTLDSGYEVPEFKGKSEVTLFNQDEWIGYEVPEFKGKSEDTSKQESPKLEGKSDLETTLKKLAKTQARLHRALDRSRRATNPDNYNPDGTVKPKSERKPWVFSKRYKKLKGQLSAIYNRIAEMRKISHNKLANEVVQLGNRFVVEDLNLQAWAVRKKETTVNEKTGRFQSKRRWGRQIHNKAPGLWLSILEQKVKSLGGEFERVDAKEYRASQYRHDLNDYVKVGLDVREFEVDGVVVDRDLYSAFVLKCGANRDIMIKEWNKFKTLANGVAIG